MNKWAAVFGIAAFRYLTKEAIKYAKPTNQYLPTCYLKYSTARQ